MVRFASIVFALAAVGFEANAHESRGVELVGTHSLQGRSSYQPIIHKIGDRWIAFVGHHGGRAVNPLTRTNEENGTSILDVTDPKSPKLIAHIPGEGGGAQMARYCNGYLLRTLGHSAHEVWDVRDPTKPVKASTVVSGLSDTHKSWWECDTGIAYLVSGAPGWRTSRMTQVYDLSDPRKPKFIRNFGLVGQQPGATGPVPTGLHGPIASEPGSNRIYFGYGTNSSGILQIVDRAKLLDGPREPTEANLLSPQVGRLDLPASYGAHTTFPLTGMAGKGDFVLIVNEALTTHCNEAHQKVWIADVTAEAKPAIVATWEVPEKSGNFCAKGRFGAHSSNESFAPIYYRKLVFIAYFNAGVRVLDIRDPARPVEVAYFIPEGSPLTNNVEVDERGYIYIVDRGSLGLHILDLTGAARRIAPRT
ncbi:hypothetical protein DSM104443_01097 [Usitatibacter rugosus]|uniref:LVIVD repeat-containing protein n=1 Tax=Usitatibacter rugosus TaxID=2732067 RepID=A0A6M4GSH8_9PROT|nr:hypothetical protein [Usitatibacter rugosus]QJR10046.1 hypothetical protein DSM104443_01097 [Usitatibacter rugosus]